MKDVTLRRINERMKMIEKSAHIWTEAPDLLPIALLYIEKCIERIREEVKKDEETVV